MNSRERLFIFSAALLSFLLPFSCKRQETIGREPAEIVKQIAADTSGTFSLVKSYGSIGKYGSIAVIGSREQCRILGNRFLTVDDVDNIDGLSRHDGLPDFAGETVDLLIDTYNAPYTVFTDESFITDSLREITVLNSLFALDSLCYYSEFNDRTKLVKPRSKVLVLSSSLCSEYGMFDVDTLIRIAGGNPLIVDPCNAMIDRAFSMGKTDIGVWTSPVVKDFQVWESVWERRPEDDVTFSVIAPPSGRFDGAGFRDFLRRFHAHRPDAKLDAVLVDSYDADLDALREEVEKIRMNILEDDLLFSRILAPEFVFIDEISALTRSCYDILRKNNLFTHNISYPVMKTYESVESSGSFLYVELGEDYYRNYVQNSD